MHFASIILLPVAAVMAAPPASTASDINQVNNGVAQSQAAIEAIKALGVNHQELVAALQTRQTGSVITDLSTLLSGLSDTLTGVCDLRDDISSLTASLGL